MNDREKKINPIRQTDDEAIALASKLMKEAGHAALAVLESETGIPLASRIAFALDDQGRPYFLASDLSFHSQALQNDPRASILVGEPGKGDPLAHPRITLIGRIGTVGRDDTDYRSLRERWLAAHPKSSLYVDFGDFRFYVMTIERAHLNGGFGKAYVLTQADLAADTQ